ncbi:hypothetical protein [Pseudomonas sp. F01002]|uniref:hypothetical protein n=1 Tax=Pseudomonas sp. F01002 TaxID=2555724 RepID=UPI00106B4568|nr:hypothetical protein [Pseudomonas sp. F01002]TFB40249.1 hypothetical protein E3W21_16510 [Pseudomonas sp. F01002]
MYLQKRGDAIASKLCSYEVWRPTLGHTRANKGRNSVNFFGHIDPLLAFPAVLSNAAPRKTVFNRISLRRTRKC